MRTTTIKPQAPAWYVIDAKEQPIGRVAARVAHLLRGKHKVSFSPHQVMSDHVIILNAEGAILKGRKAEQKVYFRHSGYPGSLKRIPFTRLFEKDPSAVLLRAVRGMLPRNRLRKEMLRHLHVYNTSEHPHEAQKPCPFSINER